MCALPFIHSWSVIMAHNSRQVKLIGVQNIHSNQEHSQRNFIHFANPDYLDLGLELNFQSCDFYQILSDNLWLNKNKSWRGPNKFILKFTNQFITKPLLIRVIHRNSTKFLFYPGVRCYRLDLRNVINYELIFIPSIHKDLPYSSLSLFMS